MTAVCVVPKSNVQASSIEQAQADLANLRSDTLTLQRALESREAALLHALGNGGDTEERTYLRGRLAVAHQMLDRHAAAIRAQEKTLSELEEHMTEATIQSLQQERDHLALAASEGDESAVERLEEIEAELRQEAVQKERAEAAARARAQRDAEGERMELERRQRAAKVRADKLLVRRRELAERVDALVQELADAGSAYLGLCGEHERELALTDAGPASAHVARPQPDRLLDSIAWPLSAVFPGRLELHRSPGMRSSCVEADPALRWEEAS